MKKGIVHSFIILISITSLISGLELSIFTSDDLADIELLDLDEEEGSSKELDNDFGEDDFEFYQYCSHTLYKRTTRSKFYQGVNLMYSFHDGDVLSPPPERIS